MTMTINLNARFGINEPFKTPGDKLHENAGRANATGDPTIAAILGIQALQLHNKGNQAERDFLEQERKDRETRKEYR